MPDRKEIQRAAMVAAWFMLLTFPLLVIKADPINKVIIWRFQNLVLVGAGSFLASLLASVFTGKERGRNSLQRAGIAASGTDSAASRQLRWPALTGTGLFFLFFPFVFSAYQTSIMTTALIYVVLGLGLNIVVGFAGLLDLGYVAFFAVGAYSYALLHLHFGVGFWLALPIGASLGALFGILLGFPVLRLRGDYLAIVTLGFGEIIRLILENWNDFSSRPERHRQYPPATAVRRCIWILLRSRPISIFCFCCWSFLPSSWSPGCAIPGSAGPGSPCGRTRSPVRPWASTRPEPN